MLEEGPRSPQTADNDDHPVRDREWALFIILAVLLGGGSALFTLLYWLFM